MRAEQRQMKISDYLQEVEFASLEELAREVHASVSTVRRDVTQLESTGLIKRTHGGARVVQPRSEEFTFTYRDTQQLAEKEAIGRACAELIESRQSLFIDAGSTVYHAAKYLESKVPQIVTNSLPVANHYASNNAIEVVVSGGVVYPRLGVLVGPLAVEAFRELRADTAIMGCGGLTLEGLTNSHVLLIDIQRAMMQTARRIIMCLDHTKLGRRSVSRLCDLEAIDVVVTDKGAPPDMVDKIRARGVKVVVAPD